MEGNGLSSSSSPAKAPAEASSSVTSRRLSILKKFGSAFGRGGVTPVVSTSPGLFSGNEVGESGSKQNVPESVGDGDSKSTLMLPPPPPPPPPAACAPVGNENGGVGNNVSGSSNGSTMRRLLEDLHRSRLSYDQDKRTYDKALLDIQEIDSKISKLTKETEKANDKFKTLGEMAAFKRTDLNAVEIRSKIVDETAKKVEQELNQVLEDLHHIRIQTAELSTAYLAEAIRFGLQWNGTELGRANRIQFDQQEIENLERQKRQLEFELGDFLVLQKGVEEVDKELHVLNQKYKELDEFHYKEELDLKKRIDEIDAKLKDLEHEEKEFQQSSFDELELIQKQINDIQNSIASLQEQSAQAKAVTRTQKNGNKRTQNRESKKFEPQKHSMMDENTLNSSEINVKFEPGTSACNENKNRFSKFQIPVKPQLQNRPNFSSLKNSFNTSYENNSDSSYVCSDEIQGSERVEGNSSSNDEDTYLVAAAAEVSQSLRGYEPVPPASTYANHGPSPAKVRAVERQTPITAFMKQMSSAKVIKRPPKSTASQAKNRTRDATKPVVNQVAPLRTSAPPPGKTFQFKKKLSNGGGTNNPTYEKENSMFSEDNVPPYQNEYEYSNGYGDNVPALFDERPFSRFNSSRVLLNDAQDQRLDMD